MTLEHVVFIVLRDEDLRLDSRVATNAFVGMPVILALERVRFVAADSVLEVGLPPDPVSSAETSSPNMAFDGFIPLVGLEYQHEQTTYVMAGVGGQASKEACLLPTLELSVGNVTASARRVVVLSDDRNFGTPAYGTLGEDLLTGGFELDFRRMHFSLLNFWDAVPPAGTPSESGHK